MSLLEGIIDSRNNPLAVVEDIAADHDWAFERSGDEVTIVEEKEGVGLEASAGNAGIIAPGHSFAWAGPRGPRMREVLALIPLRKLTLAQLVSIFGDFLAIFAVFSIVSFRLHGSPAQVSGIMIAYMLPQAFVGPAAGVFVDRWNVKRTMIASGVEAGNCRRTLTIG